MPRKLLTKSKNDCVAHSSMRRCGTSKWPHNWIRGPMCQRSGSERGQPHPKAMQRHDDVRVSVARPRRQFVNDHV
eukprot:4708231-Prymnesium_polylepis.1